jgi:beta-lactamase class A
MFSQTRHLSIVFALIVSFAVTSCTRKTEEQAHVDPASGHASRDLDSLRQRISTFLSLQPADVGVGVYAIEDGDTMSVNGDREFPMMSVAKFAQAIKLLTLVDQGQLSLSQKIVLNSTDLQVRTGSTLTKDHPGKSVSLTIPEMLKYSIGQSDNITSNKIYELEGGPQAVTDYLRSIGIADAHHVTGYANVTMDEFVRNRSTPKAQALLLKKFFANKLLSDSSTALLWTTMVESTSGQDRIKGQLPPGTVVAHKTGTSGKDSNGVLTALNDIGIMTLPNGKQVAIAVFVGNSKASEADTPKIIATVAKMVWDEFTAAR